MANQAQHGERPAEPKAPAGRDSAFGGARPDRPILHSTPDPY